MRIIKKYGKDILYKELKIAVDIAEVLLLIFLLKKQIQIKKAKAMD